MATTKYSALSRPTRPLTAAEAALDAHSRAWHPKAVLLGGWCRDCDRLIGAVVRERAASAPTPEEGL